MSAATSNIYSDFYMISCFLQTTINGSLLSVAVLLCLSHYPARRRGVRTHRGEHCLLRIAGASEKRVFGLGGPACLTLLVQSGLVCVNYELLCCFKDHHNLPKYLPLLKNTCGRQVVLDKWFPLTLVLPKLETAAACSPLRRHRAVFGWHYLPNTTCMILRRPHVFSTALLI